MLNALTSTSCLQPSAASHTRSRCRCRGEPRLQLCRLPFALRAYQQGAVTDCCCTWPLTLSPAEELMVLQRAGPPTQRPRDAPSRSGVQLPSLARVSYFLWDDPSYPAVWTRVVLVLSAVAGELYVLWT